MSKHIKNILIMVALPILYIVLSFNIAQASENYINQDNLNQGVITVNYSNSNKVKIKIRISKENVNYDYDYSKNSTYPLQLGNGTYKVMILENVSGNSYRLAHQEEVNLNLSNTNDVYLQSIQLVSWNNKSNAIKKAKELTSKAKTDKEKAIIIHNYIVKKINYDNKKAANVEAGYIPSIDDTLKSGKGICYDYSSLYASMLRSVGVPTKLVMGYSSDIDGYHAWNEVYISETNSWILVDTTYDSALPKLSKNIEKASKDYKVNLYY